MIFKCEVTIKYITPKSYMEFNFSNTVYMLCLQCPAVDILQYRSPQMSTQHIIFFKKILCCAPCPQYFFGKNNVLWQTCHKTHYFFKKYCVAYMAHKTISFWKK